MYCHFGLQQIDFDTDSLSQNIQLFTLGMNYSSLGLARVFYFLIN